MLRSVPIIRTIVASVAGLAMLGVATPTFAAAPPAAPSSLTAGFGSANLVVSWIDNASDETGFSIERCLGTGCTAFGQIATVGAGATSYADTFHASGTNRYRVRAFNGAGYSDYSNTAEIVMVSIGDISPVISSSSTAGTAPLTVTFDGSASSTLNGSIVSREWSFGDDQTAIGTIVSHTYASPGVYAASLKVTTDGFSGSVASTAVIITVASPPLVAPNDLSATSPARQQIRLAWTNPASSATALALERCKGSGCTSFTRIAVLTTSTTSFVDSTVKRGTTYRYRLAASDPTATVYSNVAVATPR